MSAYRITWTIDLEADSAQAAAEAARRIQLDPESIATVFHVSGCGDIDLSEKVGE